MTSNDETDREDFENFIVATGLDLTRTNYPMTPESEQQYTDHDTNFAWFVWQAALASKQEKDS